MHRTAHDTTTNTTTGTARGSTRHAHRRRLLAAAAGLAAVALGLSACSAGGPADDGDVEVTIWHYWDGTNADVFDQMVDDYNAENEGVTISTANVPNADFLTKLRASATSDTLPTVAIGDLVWVPQINELGSLADLSTLLPDTVLNDINPALTSFGTIDGEQVSVPVSANNLAYMYNTSLFEEAGLDPASPPATWEEVLSTGKTILEKTGKPAYELNAQAGDNGEGLTWNFQVNLWQAGGEFLTDDNSAAAFNTDAGREALGYWKELVATGVSPYAAWGEFEKGQAAAASEGSWMVGIWAPEPPFDFDVAMAPYPSDGEPATNLGGEQAMVFDGDADAAAAAADFLAWFLEPAQVTSWSEATGMLPVTDTVAASGDYLGWVDENQPRLRPYIEQMPYARARPNTPLYPAISLAFAQQIEGALSGEVSVDDALANAEKAVNDIIAEG
ncbi:ABC transporter substrate-binding protein [Compostimonas suwonensis]|uniref:Multiple sugar transport system substrate-binding protein n=1 Tax=Compostimonas suwonensis TaxID=1048394 RepID=A0A2M9C3E4_9MICO|nr:ABC transporter substrate-binding protein [Compostimonas suwonensis]PJJ65046.1 multiple sugar transport system substrate-binding protein [Compostimonas suwonensis]